MMKKKKLLMGLSVLVVSGLCLGAWYGRANSGIDSAASLTPTAVKRGNLQKAVQCTGTAISNLDVEIKCKASGLVVAMPFDISDPVKKGDLLLEVDPVDQLRSVQQAEANMAISKAKLEEARAGLAVAEANLASERKRTGAAVESAKARHEDAMKKAGREKELLARKQSTVEEAESASTTAETAAQDLQTAEAGRDTIRSLEQQIIMKQQNILLAEAQIENDTIAMDIANQRLKETKVTSPIDGVVSARTVQVGTIIASGINNIGGGTAALTLSDLSRLFVLASVDESDIGTIELGQKVEITADSYQGKKFEGKVVRIATKGKNTSNVVTFEVRVEVVSDNKALLKPEMTTNVSIIVADKKDVLILPLNALTRQGEKRVVTLAQETGQSKENHPVEVGISNGSEVEILSGVSEKDIVLVKEGVQDSQWSASSKQQKMPAPPPMMMMRPPGGGRSK